MSWAILIWTALFLVWGVGGASSISNNCAGLTGNDLAACRAGTAIGGGLGLSIIFMLWFIGFVVLAIIWFATRPRSNVTVYGPQGQQVQVTEAEAKKRVAQGWTYQPGVSVPPDPNAPPPVTGDGWRR